MTASADKKHACVKCGSTSHETNTIRTTGAGFSRFFDVQRYKWAAISCATCGYTELFRLRSGKSAADVLDFFTSH